MLIGTLRLTFHIPWANSLKDKRMVVKSLGAKLRDKFGVSVAEVAEQDIHRTAVLGVAVVGSSMSQIDSVLDHILAWVEHGCDAPLTHVRREVL